MNVHKHHTSEDHLMPAFESLSDDVKVMQCADSSVANFRLY